jgi:hypothetical protein
MKRNAPPRKMRDPVPLLAPLPICGLGELNRMAGLVGMPVLSVGYGLNWGKAFGAQPTAGLGPVISAVQCVIDRQHDVGAACRECSAERYFELCE